MVEFLRTSGISHTIEEIIIGAKNEITFVSPYLKLPKTLYERIQEKADEGIKIRFVYGKSELSKEQGSLISKLPNTSIYFLENLHAKCYINESAGIITSMNLYDFSEKNNREMGIYFKKQSNAAVFKQVNAEVESIIKASVLKSEQVKQKPLQSTKPIIEPVMPKTHPTFNEKLIQQLISEYTNYSFDYKQTHDEIRCFNFGRFFYLEVNHLGPVLRVEFQLRGEFHYKSALYERLRNQDKQLVSAIGQDLIIWRRSTFRIRLEFPIPDKSSVDIATADIAEYKDIIVKVKNLFDAILNERV